jgi:hypothetical protein
MSNIFLLENTTNFSEKINIDELFERKQKHDLNTLALYNKLLNRVHVRIKTTARQKIDEQFCWFIVPEVMIGVPKYDQPQCIAYMIEKLKDNKFNVQYIHPNTLLISWKHWVPSYVRNEIKSKTGVVVDEYGNKKEADLEIASPDNLNVASLQKINTAISVAKTSKTFTPIQSYKPQGNLVYTSDLLSKVENKIN